MTGIEASASSPPLPRWFGPRASPDDPAISALAARVARGAEWADIGGAYNLNLRIDAEPPFVLRVHRPWVRRGRVAGLRRLRERLQETNVRFAQPIQVSGRDLVRVADRWAELEEFIDHARPRAQEATYVRLFEELGRVHTALKEVWEPGPPGLVHTHDDLTLGQVHYSVGFTGRTLGRGSEPVVHRMRQLTAELASLRKEVELPQAPIHGDYKLGNVGERSDGSWVSFDLDFARIRERVYDVAASLNHVAQSGPEGVGPATRIARAATAARRLRKHGSRTADSRRAPLASRGSGPDILALGCYSEPRGPRPPRGREQNDRRRDLVVAPERTLVVVR